MRNPPTTTRTARIETARLVLRPIETQDFDAWADFHGDAEAMRHLGGVQMRSTAWRSLMCMAGAWHLTGISMFSVVEKSTGRWVGRLGPWMPDGWPGTEVGWGICRAHWGKGYAPEGAAAAIDWAFDHLGWREVVHAIAPENKASQAVARKLGARNRGAGRLPAPLDSIPVDIWGQTREEWRTHGASTVA